MRHLHELRGEVCPPDRRVEGVPLWLRHAITPCRRLRVDPEREPRICVTELRGRVAYVIAARAAERRVRPAETVERQVTDRRDARLGQFHVRSLDRRGEYIAAQVARVVSLPG